MLTSENTAWDFNPAPQIAILPLACFEPHGPHLPLGTDMILMSAIAEKVAAHMANLTFLLPTWPFGTSFIHDPHLGNISLSYSTLWAVVRDVVSSLQAHGIRQVVVLNNHGSVLDTGSRLTSNEIVKTAVRQINYESPDLIVIWVQPFSAARKELQTVFNPVSQDLHAGAVETSLMLFLAPETVGEIPDNFSLSQVPGMFDYVSVEKYAPEGVWGSPREAAAEKGKQSFEIIVDATVKYIEGTFSHLSEIKKSISP